MILLVESNFVLELAFQQEQVAHAEQLIELAAQRRIELAIPACALFEPFETLVRRRSERKATREAFLKEVRQISRSQQFPNLSQASEAVAAVLAESVETESAGLDSAISRILECAEVIPLSKQVMQHSVRIREQFSLQPQDSIVFASVDLYLSQRAKERSILANKNSRDFAVPDVQSHLAELNCTLLTSFSSALARIGHELAAG